MLLKRRAQEMVFCPIKQFGNSRIIVRSFPVKSLLAAEKTKSMEFPLGANQRFSAGAPSRTVSHSEPIANDIKERIEKGLLDMGLLTEPVNVGKYVVYPYAAKRAGGVLTRRDSACLEKEIRLRICSTSLC